MVDSEDEVLLQRPRQIGIRPFARDHVEVVRCMGQLGVGRNRVQTPRQAVDRGDQRGGRGGYADQIAAQLGRVEIPDRLQSPRRARQRKSGAKAAQRVDPDEAVSARAGPDYPRQLCGNACRKLSVGPHRRGELIAGRPVPGQGTVEEELPNVLEGAFLCQLHRRVLAIVIEALQAADVTDLGLGDLDSLQAGRNADGFRTAAHEDILIVRTI